MSLQATTWQTVGPFFCIGFERLFEADIAGEGVLGERVAVQGRVLDGDGIPIPDAVIEIWQANVHGKYAHPADTQDKPLEQGFDVKLTAGIHGGCMRVLATRSSGIVDLQGLKGRTIGVSDMIIVHTKDATMICPKREAQRVKELVGKVKEKFGTKFD